MLKNDLGKLLIAEDATIRLALQRLCESGHQTLFVVDEGGILKGSLTDGDIRRFLLKGGSMDAKAGDAANFKPKFIFSTERRNAESVMQDEHINALPVVDEGMRVIEHQKCTDNNDLIRFAATVKMQTDRPDGRQPLPWEIHSKRHVSNNQTILLLVPSQRANVDNVNQMGIFA